MCEFLCPGTEQSEQGDPLDPLRGEEAVDSGQVWDKRSPTSSQYGQVESLSLIFPISCSCYTRFSHMLIIEICRKL